MFTSSCQKSYKFKSTVVVNEVEDLSHSVTWTIEGNNSIDTIINANGEISIAENETSNRLIVKATSNVDPTKSGVAIVNVKEAIKPTLDEVDGLSWDGKVAKWNPVKNATSYELTVLRDNIVIGTRETINNFYDLSEFFNKTGKYSFKVVAKANGYTNSTNSNDSVENDFIKSNDKPVILGAEDISIEFESQFDKYAGVTVTDTEDKDLTNKLIVTGDVNVNVAGIYEITYSVTDSDGNTTTAIRKVTVKPKKEEPEVKPEKPEVKPEEPEVKPEKPEVKPEKPEVKPEKPEVKPEEPEVKPEKPEVKPEVKPEKPEVKPEEPEVKPEKPEINPELPGQEEKVENSNLINKLPKTGKMPTIILGLLITIGGAFIYKKKK